MAKIKILTDPAEILKARLNQPRMSLEYLLEQTERHRHASEEFSKAVRNGTSKYGPKKQAAGVTRCSPGLPAERFSW
jgi:hypothetical protein